MSTVTIGFIPRERFSVAAKCLQRIYDCTSYPFQPDCGGLGLVIFDLQDKLEAPA